MMLYQCPNCKDTYSEFDNLYYCPKCRYRLKKVEEQPEPVVIQTQSSKPTVTCPYCKSTNTKKISGTSRWMSTGIFGLASGKLGKQWKCNNCKSTF